MQDQLYHHPDASEGEKDSLDCMSVSMKIVLNAVQEHEEATYSMDNYSQHIEEYTRWIALREL